MDLHAKLGPQQKQQLGLSTAMRQSLRVLRMPLWELRDYLNQQLCENPMLELDAAAEPSEEFAPLALDAREEPPPPEERPEWETHEPYQNIWQGTATAAGIDVSRLHSRAPGFREMLLEQVGALPLKEDFAELCRYLVESLDRRGYLDTAPSTVAQQLGIAQFDVMQALYLVQSLQPAGVGARNLEECLMLQLVQSEHFNAGTIKLVKEGLPFLAADDMEAISALLGVGVPQAEQAAAAIRALAPVPSRGYDTGDEATPVIPDASVRYEEERFHITLNEGGLPKLELSRQYCLLLEQSGRDELGEYLRQKLADAKEVISAVSARNTTMIRVLDAVTALQPAFFREAAPLRPMTMAQLADALQLHLSTVSRAVSDKYIVCAAGTVPLKSLFTAEVASRQGQALSAQMVMQQLRRLIEAEERTRPLSDEALREALQALGIAISRRTVAKYREELNIASSARRRQKA